MTVIKNHTSIICAVNISNGEQVILDGSHFLSLFLSQTNMNNAHIHTAEKVKSIKTATYVIIWPILSDS